MPDGEASGRARPRNASSEDSVQVAASSSDASHGAGGPPRHGQAGGQSRSPAKVAAAQENGARGGRPAPKMPPEVMERLGPVPSSAKELRLWRTRFAAELLVLEATGRISGSFAHRMRAGVLTLDKVAAKTDEDLPDPEPTDPPPRAPGDDEDDDEDGARGGGAAAAEDGHAETPIAVS